jgi:hypothetical protein
VDSIADIVTRISEFGYCIEYEEENALLLEVILTGAAGVTAREGTLMIPFPRVDAGVSRQVTARGEGLGTYVTHVLFFVCRRGNDLRRLRMVVEIGGILGELALWIGCKMVGRRS